MCFLRVMLFRYRLLKFKNKITATPTNLKSLRVYFLKFKSPIILKSKTFFKSKILKFGTHALVPLNPILIKLSYLYRFVLLLKKLAKKKDKSHKRFWFSIGSVLKLTKQSRGSRMGKGKGSSIQQVFIFYPHNNFIEFSGIRLGRLNYFLKSLNSSFFSLFYFYPNIGLRYFSMSLDLNLLKNTFPFFFK